MSDIYHYDIELVRLVHEGIRERNALEQQSTQEEREVERQFRRMPEYVDIPYKNLPSITTAEYIRSFLENLNNSFRLDPECVFDFSKLHKPQKGFYVGIGLTVSLINTSRYPPVILSTNRQTVEWLAQENISLVIEDLPGDYRRTSLG
ncbi:hypothetical protein VKT23_010097 [Stygiomarasmius scandens]|uniref:Uncharacterized protein n=1 Tax=Marasmiellus scandens TaxID=2682957 RepID=A0ABR1JC30_9AGAR